jgi:hypothetical protein
MAIFNPNRKQGGTIELVRDAQGNYTTKEVGFNTLNSLSIPDFKTTATTTTTTDTKTATDNTGDTITSQTQMAFQVPGRDDDNRIDTTGDMLQESARQTSAALIDTFSKPNMREVAGEKITSPLDIQSPTETVFSKPNMREVAGETRMSAQEAAPQEDLVSNVSLEKPAVTSANVQRGLVEAPGIDFDFLKGDRFKQGTASTNPVGGVDQIAADAMTRQEMISGASPDDPTANQLGVTTAKPAETALDVDRFAGVSRMGALAGDEKKDVKPVKRNALETVSTSLKTTKDSILSKIKTPMMMVLDAVTPDPTAVNKHDVSYFTDRGDGRIGGNPATDLYAGMNRVSAFGNLEKAGEKRIATREKTIEKKGYKPGDKFYDDTQKMKDQQKDYKSSLDKKVTTKREAGIMNQPGAGGDKSGRTGGKIVCTMMNESYGFGSFRNKIWMKFHGNIAPEYQKGYHRIFLPLVNYAKQKGITNKIIKNILEHIAVHSTIDMRQTLRGKRHTLGRLYRKVILPLCYWVGKI